MVSLTATEVATLIGVAVATATLFRGLVQYGRDAVLKRIDYLAKLKNAFLEDEKLARITELLETDDQKLKQIAPRDKWRYLYFFEEVALLLKAKLLSNEIACYIVGYHALQCDRSQTFWCDSFPKDKSYWLLFFDFVERMKEVERFKNDNREAFVAKIRI
jgi:hypothetical protein